MYKRSYIILSLILIALFVISMSTHLYAHKWGWRAWVDHDNVSKFLEATKTQITCNISNNQIFSKKDYYYSDGYFNSSSGWYPSLKNPAEISISGKAHGLGYAQILFYGNVDNQKFGDVKDLSPEIDIGSTFLFIANEAHDADVSRLKSVTYTASNGAHNWNGSGTIYYTPIYFKIRVGLPAGISGTWEDGATWSSSGSAGGSWKIIDTDATLSYPKYPSTGSGSTPSTPSTPSPPTETDDSDDDDNNGNSGSNDLYASDGNYTLYAGDTHNATCVTHSPYSYVAWYVDDFLWETDDNPDGTSTEASFSHTFDDPGTYTIKVQIQILNGAYSTESYTITVQ